MNRPCCMVFASASCLCDRQLICAAERPRFSTEIAKHGELPQQEDQGDEKRRIREWRTRRARAHGSRERRTRENRTLEEHPLRSGRTGGTGHRNEGRESMQHKADQSAGCGTRCVQGSSWQLQDRSKQPGWASMGEACAIEDERPHEQTLLHGVCKCVMPVRPASDLGC